MSATKKRARVRLVLEGATVTLRTVHEPGGSVTLTLIVRAGPKSRIVESRGVLRSQKPAKGKRKP